MASVSVFFFIKLFKIQIAKKKEKKSFIYIS